jgi:hypothetical protein
LSSIVERITSTFVLASVDTFREGMLAVLKIKTDGKQTVVVQHVTVSEGGRAVIAGNLSKSGWSMRSARSATVVASSNRPSPRPTVRRDPKVAAG